MKITLLNHTKLNEIPSGSGIAKSGEGYYIIGDDSPYLYFLNENFEVVSKTLISDDKNFDGKRIVKSEKADFETLELINEKELVVFGSGGKSPQRDKFARIFLNDEITTKKYDISEFYTRFRNLPILKDSELNIEGTAFYDGQLYLFNRRKNVLFKFDYQDFLKFLKGESSFPKLMFKEYALPKINGVEAGFSGATILKNEPKIIFTASVEDTPNAYDDGAILGSFIGMFDISNNCLSENIDYCPVLNVDDNLKIESVTIIEEKSGEAEIIMIADDDQGGSMLINGLIYW